MSDYQKIARAIDFIRTNTRKQPSLADIAAHVHLSEYHFQRLFSRWAGVSPKRFLQILTLESSKDQLKQTQQSALQISYDLGLSSASRLYDHFVQLEAATPSEYRRGGQGIAIFYGYHDTPYGEAFVALTARGICRLNFIEQGGRDDVLHNLALTWPHAELKQDPAQTATVIEKLFAGTHNTTLSGSAPLSLWVRGTNFQIQVWRALLSLPQGRVSTYGDIAQAIGKSKAVRAVGTAIGANPVAFIIPCHRVIRQTGAVGGYRWGETRKHAMLVRECAQTQK